MSSLADVDDRLDGGVWGLAHEVKGLGAVLEVEVVGDDGLNVDGTRVEQRDALGVPAWLAGAKNVFKEVVC